MNSKRDFFMDAFLNLVWLAIFYGGFVVPAIMLLHLRVDILLLVSGVMCFGFLLMRRIIRPVVPMVLAHIIVPVLAFYFAPGSFEQAMYVGVAIALALFSFQQRHKRSFTFTTGTVYAAPIVLIALALFMGTRGHDYIYTTYAALIILVSIGSKLHIRMTHVNDSLGVITQTSTQPVKKILAFDYKAMVVLSLLMVGLVLFLHVFLMRPALEAISGINIRMPQFDSSYTADEPFIPPMDIGPGFDLYEYLAGEPFSGPLWLWVILERLLFFVMPPLIVLGIGILLFRLIRKIYRQLGIKTRQSQEHASGYEDIKEFIRTPKVRRPWFFGSRNEHKLRKLFRETVTRHMKKGVPIEKSDTPVQMAEKIQGEDIRALAEEYAAVRYGNNS